MTTDDIRTLLKNYEDWAYEVQLAALTLQESHEGVYDTYGLRPREELLRLTGAAALLSARLNRRVAELLDGG